MTVRASQSITRVFTLRRTDTQAAANADSLPTGTLYVNGTADAATVTVTNITTGVYKAAVTMPSGLVIGDAVDLRINATVNSVSDNAVIWQDLVDVAINSSGHVSRVVLCDTTTTNTDMRGTDNAALASVWTATRGGYLDAAISSRSSHSAADVWSIATRTLSTAGVSAIAGGVWDELLTAHTVSGSFGAKLLRSSNTQNEVQVTGSNHVAADVHESQPGSIHANTFDAGAIDAAALAADAASEIASAVRTELTTELGRIDAAVSTRLATSGYTTPPTAATIADTVLGRSVVNVESTAAEHSLCTLILGATESAVSGSTWTIYETDGTTTYRIKTITTDGTAEPITAVS